ncbi:glycosyltransferase family 2 protein [Acinetobacter soli]|uniref:glycosyltransferase family 2 protein n=1 Tax=Acinetobacter soli TaxID=487316 RepID=UPI002D7EB74E|nr:glycosyltransferase family 2 protein [Acinetobacter soli]MEB4800909.1 glycosyltransferase family 2 protein [Acinetobacter soli]
MNAITIVIPTFNRLDLLKIALESCLNQTYLPFEIIIGDDSNNDETERWINGLNHQGIKIRYYHHKPSLKQADNVEFIIQKVQTDWMLLLHDDDYLLPDALNDLFLTVSDINDLDVIFGKQYIINHSGEIDVKGSEKLNKFYRRTKQFELINLDPMEVALKQQLPSNSFLIKTDLAKTTHYNFKEIAGDAIDFYFCLLLAIKNSKFIFIDKYISCYRITNNSISSNSNAGYYSYRIVESLKLNNKKHEKYKNKFLYNMAPIAIRDAKKNIGIHEAKRIFFSKYNLRKPISFRVLVEFFKLYFKI